MFLITYPPGNINTITYIWLLAFPTFNFMHFTFIISEICAFETAAIVALICLLLVLFMVGSFFYFIAISLFKAFRNSHDDLLLRFKRNFDGSIRSEYEKYFIGKMPYFEKLPDKLKLKFLLRVRKFIRHRSFEGRNGFEVTNEIKARIAGAAIQLTLGLDEFTLDHFSKIIVYPESYYSKLTGKFHMGEANVRGILVISWKDFIKGYSIPDDSFNVGLHEMAHALELSKRLGGNYDLYFSQYYEKWKRITREEYENLRDDKDSFLRSYAGTNRSEFFAVCIEHFFEKSEEFRNRLPDIYFHLCILLNQDPLRSDMQVERFNKGPQTIAAGL